VRFRKKSGVLLFIQQFKRGGVIMKENEMAVKTFLTASDVLEDESLLQKISLCYKCVYNGEPWNENWTDESAKAEIIQNLMPTKDREPLLSLMLLDNQVIGMFIIILAKKDGIKINDMPFNLNDEEKKIGVESIKFWLALNKHTETMILKETAILKEYRVTGTIPPASLLMKPLISEAAKRAYKTLIYWTAPTSTAYTHGLRFGWHPIHFFPEKNRVILKGNVKDYNDILDGIFAGDRKTFAKMNQNKKNYMCS
jgi:hypothetical protein